MRVFECAEGLCFIGKLFLDAAYLRMRVGAVLDDTLGVRARSAVRRRGVVISAILAVCKDANNYDAETHFIEYLHDVSVLFTAYYMAI